MNLLNKFIIGGILLLILLAGCGERGGNGGPATSSNGNGSPPSPINIPEEAMSEVITALKSGDIEGAVQQFEAGKQDDYLEILTKIKQAGNLSQLAGELAGMQEVYTQENIAKYMIERQENGETVTYFIYFILEGGKWKIHAL